MNLKPEEREIGSFETIKVNGAFTIYLSQDDDYSLKVVADENLLDIIKTKIKGDVLYISTEKSIYKSKEIKSSLAFILQSPSLACILLIRVRFNKNR